MDQMECLRQELRQLITRNRIGDNSTARIVRRQNSSNHGNQGIAVHFFPVGQNGTHAVDIGIENEA